MVKYQRYNLYNHWKKNKEHVVHDDEESYLRSICGNSGYCNKKPSPKLLYFTVLSLISCSLILAPQILSSNSNFSVFCKPYFLFFLGFFFVIILLSLFIVFVLCGLADPFRFDDEGLGSEPDGNGLCSSVPNG